ncbi:ABC transporter substrate-binding protein [Gloeobacter kilaueensis]|uniref:ABC transporter substrate-binding protein n=1 Tax=Gloeobacter kilaueensis TaxID=1416614 RepID=UPI0004197112|nr:ABC transporter substrate-binding protein [Gloeobacter kilaueensis]
MFLLTALGLLLAGCQKAPPADGPIELVFWHGANPQANRIVLEGLVERFNRRHPDIHVRAVDAGQPDQQIPKILAAVIGGSPPDLLWYNATLTGQLVKADAIVPLDAYLAREPVLGQVFPNLLPATRYRGQTWSLPFDTNNLAVFYNKRLFAAAGIKTFPRTWEAFFDLARKLTVDQNGDGRPERYGFRLPLGKGEWTVFNWLAWYWGAGGELLKQGKPQIASGAGVAALTYWQRFLDPSRPAASLSQPEQGYLFDDFFAGRVAMQVSGPWTLRELAQNQMSYGIFPLPQGAVAATSIGGEQLFLMRTSARREQASWQFAKYILSTEFQSAWATGTGYLPVTIEAARSPSYRAFLKRNPQLQVFLDQLPHGHNRPLDPTYPQISDALGQAVEQALQHVRTPAQALEAAQREAELIVRTQPGDTGF